VAPVKLDPPQFMRLLRRNPNAIAHWRHAQIEEALATPTSDVRAPWYALRTGLLSCGQQPDEARLAGRARPVDVTLQGGGLAALHPVRRRDIGRPRAKLSADVLRRPFRCLSGDPEISYPFLLALLRTDPPRGARDHSLALDGPAAADGRSHAICTTSGTRTPRDPSPSVSLAG